MASPDATPMHVLISIDLEGVAGIATRQQTLPTGRDYGRARVLMTAEANAAIAGAFNGGATSVIVVDSHGPADNLIAESLDDRAEYIVGDPKPLDMVEGVTADTGVVFFVGYHAGAGAASGVLNHTFSGGGFTDVLVNGESVTEAEINALLAAEFGVAVGLVTGDDVICELAEEKFTGVVAVSVKSAVSRTAAKSMHPHLACESILAGAASAVQRAAKGDLAPVTIPAQLEVTAEFRPSGAVDLAALVPGSRRIDNRTVSFDAPTPRVAMDVLNVWAALAGYSATR